MPPTSDSDLHALRKLGRLSAESKWVICQAVHDGETAVCGRLTCVHAPGGRVPKFDCGRDSPANRLLSHKTKQMSTRNPGVPAGGPSSSRQRYQQGSVVKKEEEMGPDIKCVHCFSVTVGVQALLQHYRTEPALHDNLVEEAAILGQYPELAHSVHSNPGVF
ncbi:hypothetical protein PG985_013109 [Apiospora marii]